MAEHESSTNDAPTIPVFDAEDLAALEQLIDEHEEEVIEEGEAVRRRGIYLLPNLFTTGALFAGFYAVIAAVQGDFEAAPIAIFFAMVFDGLDGRVARLTHTSSKFGAEYDSLSDMVSFGVAPALVIFMYALEGLGKFGWSAAFVYLACAALRLARFNTQIDHDDGEHFTGLASPAAAAVIASGVWLAHDIGFTTPQSVPAELGVVLAFMTAIIGLGMVANFKYPSFKGVDFRGRVPFVVILLVVIVFSLVTLHPPTVFLITFVVYALSSPVLIVMKKLKSTGPTEPPKP